MKMFKFYQILFISVFIILSILSIYNETKAIPAFARKYKTSCATCHIAVTKRNAFGEAFRRNGYVMPKKDSRLVKDPPLSLGAETWKEVWPEAVWPSNIPGTFPLSAFTHFRTEYNFKDPSSTDNFSMSMPWDYGLLFGGTFADDIGFFGAWSNKFGLNRLFFRFNDIIGPKRSLNLRMGLFEPGILDGYQGNQRLTLEYTALQNFAAAGDWKPSTTHGGIEVNGILNHYFQYSVGLLNSISPSIKQDYYTRIAYKFGGYGLDGEGILIDSSNMDYWTDDSFVLGIFAYSGNTLKKDSVNIFHNALSRIGLDARYTLGNLDLLGGAIFGNDNFKNPGNGIVKSLAYFIEGDYIFYPWLITALRLEKVNSETSDLKMENFTNLVPNITVLWRQNVRISFEAFFSVQSENGNTVNSSQNSGILQSIYGSTSMPFRSDKALKWIKINGFCAF